MPSDAVKRIRDLAEETAVELVWAQWSALTSLAVADDERQTCSIVDPEALVLASLVLARSERRLEDLVAAWADTASFLMSKPRFKSIREIFPAPAASKLSAFARYAVDGGDTRWKSWASEATDDLAPRRKSMGPLRITEGPSLVLRLRAGFGLSAKADLLAILLGLHGEEASLNLLIEATGYSGRTIRTATEEMALSGIIVEREGRPSSFQVPPEPWEEVLYRFPPDPDRPTIPPWRFWAAILAFLCHVSRWAEEASSENWTDYVASSHARNLYEEHSRRLGQAGIHLPPIPPADRTERALDAFRDIVHRVCTYGLEGL